MSKENFSKTYLLFSVNGLSSVAVQTIGQCILNTNGEAISVKLELFCSFLFVSHRYEPQCSQRSKRL